MRKYLIAACVAALTAAALPAVAGDCMEGFSCDHVCPLAREANEHRSSGFEALTKAPSGRALLAASVERNLRKV